MADESSNTQPQPAHTRVAVAGALCRNGRVLVNRASYRSRFTLPSGYVGPGEGLESALVREVQEETGLNVGVDDLLIARYEVSTTRWSDAYYAFRLHHVSGEPSAQPPEIAEVKDVPLERALDAEWISDASKLVIRLALASDRGWSRSAWRSSVDVPLVSEAYLA
jgi:8-oxo-dGTP pyrophosphatase MutT (NUDIX family)